MRRGVEIIAIAPDRPNTPRRYWTENRVPFIGVADAQHRVARLYGQEVRLLKLGRLPLLVLVDQQGLVRWQHYADSMADIPDTASLLTLIDQSE